jgi:STE24 endopeptidase
LEEKMQPLAIIILTAILADGGLNFTADLLNLKAIRTRLPRGFEGWYPQEAYRKSQEYLKARTYFGWLAGGVDILVLLLFWLGRGFAWLDERVRDLDWPMLWTGLLYIGALLGLKAMLAAPFSAYATFGIEQRFGFNQTSWGTYVKDRIKTVVLSVALGAPLLAAVLAFFQYAGANAWWMCWLATVVFMLLIQYIAPTWIMPWFNRFEPLQEGALRGAIMAYARRIDFALDNIFVMDGSRRSSKSNAFFTGFGHHRRIVLFDTLVEKHSVDELVAVLAHEMGHYKEKHILKNLLIGTLQAGVMFYILSFFITYQGLFDAFYVRQVSVYAGLVFFGMLYAPLDRFVGLAVQAISRHHEYAADRFAVRTSGSGQALIQALKKLSLHNLSNLQPHPLYVFLNYSHPPLLQRIQAIENLTPPNPTNPTKH